jgi:HTH-type transcriptional regulator, sugar sensing transcriptional regulator
MMSIDVNVLEDIGLTKGEIKVYIALLELGSSHVGPVVERSGLASSAVHNALHALAEKGMVGVIRKNRINLYIPVPPKQLLSYLEQKKDRLVQLIPTLEARQKMPEQEEVAEVFEGKKAIMSMLYLLLEGDGTEYLFFAINTDENEDAQEFFRRYDAKRKERGLVVKGIASPQLKPYFSKRDLQMKYTDNPIPSNISICNGKVALFSWGEKPIGYLLSSPHMANMYLEYFHKTWRSA